MRTLKHHSVPIVCEACQHSWIEDVDVDAYGDMTLPFNEDWKCVECEAPFDFDDFAGEVRAQ